MSMVDEETLNFRIPVRIGIGPLKIHPMCSVTVARKFVALVVRNRSPALG